MKGIQRAAPVNTGMARKQSQLIAGPRVLRRFSLVQLCVTPRTVARQTPLSMGILQARMLEWVAMASSRGSSPPRDQMQVS